MKNMYLYTTEIFIQIKKGGPSAIRYAFKK